MGTNFYLKPKKEVERKDVDIIFPQEHVILGRHYPTSIATTKIFIDYNSQEAINVLLDDLNKKYQRYSLITFMNKNDYLNFVTNADEDLNLFLSRRFNGEFGSFTSYPSLFNGFQEFKEFYDKYRIILQIEDEYGNGIKLDYFEEEFNDR